MHLERTTAPATDIITVAEAARRLFADATYDEAFLQDSIKAAIKLAEDWCERAFITQIWTLTLDKFPTVTDINPKAAIYLPRGKCQSVTSLTYIDKDGTEQELEEGTHFTVTKTGSYGRILLKSGQTWPETDTYTDEAVTVVYTVGFGDTLPTDKTDLKTACMLLVGSLYEIRQSHGTFRIEDSHFHQLWLSDYKIYKDFGLYNDH